MRDRDSASTIRSVSNKGERVVAGYRDFNYYAHLSIYRFAAPLVPGKQVLDAGCGTGYGAVHLAENGAHSVTALDASGVAIDYCRQRFAGKPVKFEVADLGRELPFGDASFDVIFSSNVMEHIADIDTFLASCARVLRPDGRMVIAVPPIVSPAALADNIRNVHHVTNLTPRGWYSKIGRFFGAVRCHRHVLAPPFDDAAAGRAQFDLGARTTLRETDFVFPETDLVTLDNCAANMTAVFVAASPRAHALPPSLDEELPRDWHVGAIHAGILAEALGRARPSPRDFARRLLSRLRRLTVATTGR